MAKTSEQAMLSEIEASPRPWWAPQMKFLVHAVVGTTIFGIVASVGIVINVVVRALEKSGVVEPLILWGLRGAEYALFSADLAAYGVFLWRTTRRLVREL